jgi:hypothetical protein
MSGFWAASFLNSARAPAVVVRRQPIFDVAVLDGRDVADLETRGRDADLRPVEHLHGNLQDVVGLLDVRVHRDAGLLRGRVHAAARQVRVVIRQGVIDVE